MVAGNDLDLAAFVGGVCSNEIGCRLPRGEYRSRSGRRGVNPRQIGQHADLDGLIGGLDRCGNRGRPGRKQRQPRTDFHDTLPLWSVTATLSIRSCAAAPSVLPIGQHGTTAHSTHISTAPPTDTAPPTTTSASPAAIGTMLSAKNRATCTRPGCA